MGLDMYLMRTKRIRFGKYNNEILDIPIKDYLDVDNVVLSIKTSLSLDEAKDWARANHMLEDYADSIVLCGEHIQWYSIFERVAYWRKANQIHNWFVNHVQFGEDNCEYHVATKDMLQTLLDLCITVKENPDKAGRLLPPQEGFFFGSYEIDEWYWKDIDDTIEQLTTVINETDFDNQLVFYLASW